MYIVGCHRVGLVFILEYCCLVEIYTKICRIVEGAVKNSLIGNYLDAGLSHIPFDRSANVRGLWHCDGEPASHLLEKWSCLYPVAFAY